MFQRVGISADYLLGLNDTLKPNAALRTAMEYTGSSEAVVEWLRIGLDDFECDGVEMSEEEKEKIWGKRLR